ncbi:MAG: phosphoribosylglycinamide formyltransferase [Planctomycetota bacterium]|nr:MAG: phosphoribosylglycinamide formyltransferase [Planctomycetota bacterium]
MKAAVREPLSIAVLVSGGGSTLANLIARIDTRRLRGVRIRRVISSRAGVGAVEIAQRAGLPTTVIRKADYASLRDFGTAIALQLDADDVELVVMGGFLCLWDFPPRYEGRALNIHPALLPKFGGRGMHGMRVHEAVLKSGATESGCTVHIADRLYDHGPIVAQQRVDVLPGDTPESLAARVAAAERELYPRVIQAVADHGLKWLRRFQRAGGGEPLS